MYISEHNQNAQNYGNRTQNSAIKQLLETAPRHEDVH